MHVPQINFCNGSYSHVVVRVSRVSRVNLSRRHGHNQVSDSTRLVPAWAVNHPNSNAQLTYYTYFYVSPYLLAICLQKSYAPDSMKFRTNITAVKTFHRKFPFRSVSSIIRSFADSSNFTRLDVLKNN